MTVWFPVSSLGPCSTPALHLIFPAGSVQILSLCQGERRSDASVAAFPRSVRCCVWFAAGQECEVVVWHFRRRGRMVVDIPLVARSFWDVRSSSASLGSAGTDVLLCGVGSSVGLGNCLTHTDKKWQIISAFFISSKFPWKLCTSSECSECFTQALKLEGWTHFTGQRRKQMYWEVIGKG